MYKDWNDYYHDCSTHEQNHQELQDIIRNQESQIHELKKELERATDKSLILALEVTIDRQRKEISQLKTELKAAQDRNSRLELFLASIPNAPFAPALQP